jgi:hypothetical protein
MIVFVLQIVVVPLVLAGTLASHRLREVLSATSVLRPVTMCDLLLVVALQFWLCWIWSMSVSAQECAGQVLILGALSCSPVWCCVMVFWLCMLWCTNSLLLWCLLLPFSLGSLFVLASTCQLAVV